MLQAPFRPFRPRVALADLPVFTREYWDVRQVGGLAELLVEVELAAGVGNSEGQKQGAAPTGVYMWSRNVIHFFSRSCPKSGNVSQ
jgi:hypothetical protein